MAHIHVLNGTDISVPFGLNESYIHLFINILTNPH